MEPLFDFDVDPNVVPNSRRRRHSDSALKPFSAVALRGASRREEDEDEGDDCHDPGEEAEAGILEQIPPPLLGPAEARGGEDEHVVLLPHRGLLHLVLPAVVDLLAARLHKQLADAPVGELLAKRDGTRLRRAVKFPNPVKVEDCSHAPGVAIKKVFIVSIIPK